MHAYFTDATDYLNALEIVVSATSNVTQHVTYTFWLPSTTKVFFNAKHIEGLLPTEYRRESHKCERDRTLMVWSSFLGTGVTERNKKST